VTHSVFAIVAPVARGRVGALQRWLDPDSRGSAALPGFSFDDLATVHFASVVVFPAPAGDGLPDDLAGTLVFENCVDGSIDAYLDTLVHVGAGPLVELFSQCLDYEPRAAEPRTYLRTYLRSHVRMPHLHHIGTPRMATHHIESGVALRRVLDCALDEIVALGRSHDRARTIVERLRRRLRVPPSPEDHWHLAPDSVPDERYAWYADPVFPWMSRLRPWARLLAALVPLFAVLWAAVWALVTGRGLTALIVAGLLGAMAWAIWRWLTGRHPPPMVDPASVQRLAELEDVGLVNHMTSLAPLKPGLARRVALRVVLGAFNLAYRTVFTDLTPGRLSGLPTIHFAQWTSVPYFDACGRPTAHKGLLFLSNYDGSWETYLDDFLAHLMHGVVAIWANTAGFPWPLDDPTFKRWARGRMSPWQVWHQHAGYERLTVSNIHNNDRIRKELLAGPESDHAARLWLARFGALQTGHESFDETRQLEEPDIQGLVLSGFAGLDAATYVLLEIADGADAATAARRWLAREVLPRIVNARERSIDERRANDVAVNIAFTWCGLHKLGLDASGLDAFPLVFKEGMAPAHLKHRSRILGDVERCDPARWAWGNAAHPVDVLLMVFARPGAPGELADLLRHFLPTGGPPAADDTRRGGGVAGRVVESIKGQLLRDPGQPSAFVEHFGFRDGLSDPVLEGSWRARRQPYSMHLVKPGEFLMGYPAADGTPAPTIAVSDEADPHDLLPSVDEAPERRDFGRNGTYLVCRQLSQHVGEFRKAVAEAAGGPYEGEVARGVAARVVGRWRDGTPLHGVEAGHGCPSNEFGFADDPHGVGCPIGAHIRRANPRDSLGPDVASALRSAGRHRMLRRGRPYGPPLPDGMPDDGHERGLVFICLNGDIERQFEFVQQNWIGNPSFGGLYGEADPLIGAGPLTMQADGVRRRVTGLSGFVTVRGGQYFFLPGLSALRYLASGRAAPLGIQAADVLARPAAVPEVRRPTRLRAALTVVEMVLPWLRTAWAVRVPLLLAGTLVLLALGPRLSPAIAPTLFLAERARGVFAVALLASLMASVAMITLRIVLLYGERLGLARARWTGAARWPQVLAFQALAFPVMWVVVAETTRDREAAGQTTFWAGVLYLAPIAVLGLLAGQACMWLATSLQALKPGARPELFFPPNPLARWMGLRSATASLPRPIARLQAACAAWIVDGVPQGIGTGYIDYRRRRLLPGHAFAMSLALVILVLYVAGFFALHPAHSAAASDLPPIAYLIGVMIAACWLLAGLTFFFDRYHVPTIGVLVAWLTIVGMVARTDHYFEVKGPVEPAVSPSTPSGPVVVVAAEGLGLVSSAWTAEVLTGLSESLGASFTGSLRLISAASGASLGTVYFVDEYTDAGFGGRAASHEIAAGLEAVRMRARTPGSSESAWGLAYPDLVRLFAPVFVPRRMDRDWARESAWRRALDNRRPEPTLSAWRRDVAAGWRPAVAFGVTVVESGERGLLATYESPARVRDVTGNRDVSMLTAARLSAAFPLVSAAARPDTGDAAAFHVTDGGFWDNSGIVAAIEWLEAARPASPDRVVFVEVRSSSPRRTHIPENASWLLQLSAPLRTLIGVRYEGQPFRNESALETYSRLWQHRHGTPLARVTFELNDDELPLTWNLGHAAPARLRAAWQRHDVQAEVDRLRALLAAPR
jgi:Dyp-type peroxidase family